MAFNESGPWKDELGQIAKWFREYSDLTHFQSGSEPESEELDWEEETWEIFLIEKKVLLGCIAVRRLLEMPLKVTIGLLDDRRIPVLSFPLQSNTRPPDHFDALVPERHYDLTKPSEDTITARSLCNLFIHSHMQAPAWDLVGLDLQETLILPENDPRLAGPIRLGGFYVTSDRRKKHLMRVELDSLIECFEKVAADDMTGLSMRRNADGDWEVVEARGPDSN